MPLRIYNTLTKQKQEFKPLNPPNVAMYVCGITPYDETHLGHGRAYVTFDIIRRYLEESGFKVRYVQNVTDVDDKIIQKSQKLNVAWSKVASTYTDAYLKVMGDLNVKDADEYPKATEHIGEMVKWIEGLVEGGYAYVVDSDVYFEVDKFKDYGKLSNRKKKDMLAGARVAIDKRKKSPLDFALWKAAKEGEPSWDSPWGPGRPGWHIECSVMSTKYLGQQFDIHGGGLDLVFPHHENEIAQTEAQTRKPWVKYWIHNGFVNINKQKMSKSLGNFFTLKDIFKKFDPMVVRLFLLQTHYRSPINFSDEQLVQAKVTLERLERFIADLDFRIEKTVDSQKISRIKNLEKTLSGIKNEFREIMNDDFNTGAAIGFIFFAVHFSNEILAKEKVGIEDLRLMKDTVLKFCEILGLKVVPPAGPILSKAQEEKINKLVAERQKARDNKDFAKADEIREKIMTMGSSVVDTPYGARVIKL